MSFINSRKNTRSVYDAGHLIFAHKRAEFQAVDHRLAGIHIARDFCVRIRWIFFERTFQSGFMTLGRETTGELHTKRIEKLSEYYFLRIRLRHSVQKLWRVLGEGEGARDLCQLISVSEHSFASN